MNKQQPGAILIFSLMMLSLLVLLTQQLVKSVFVGSQFIKTMIERERSEMLTLAGINLACTQLVAQKDDNKDKEQEQEKKMPPPNMLLKTLLPHLNRWQTFELQESRDGIAGTIKICIVCEHGKININQIIDFETNTFKPAFTPLVKALEVKGIVKNGELSDKLLEFFGKRKTKLNDISELTLIPELRKTRLFYQPPEVPAHGTKYEPNDQLALQDIFTTWTNNAALEPLMLSDSVCSILGLQRPRADDARTRQKEFDKLIETYKPEMSKQWEENWAILEELYGKRPINLSEFVSIFSKQFGPTIFSVLSYGKVGHVEQRALAIIKKEKVKQKTSAQQDDGAKKEKYTERYKIVRLYWL